MTSSTSNSKTSLRPAWSVGLGLLVFSAVVGLPIWAMVNLKAPPATFIKEMNRDLVQAQPKLVLLGNSVAREAIDKPMLSASLGLDPGQAHPILIGGSSAGHWYSAVKNQVFGAGYRPDVIVVYTPFSQWRTDLGAPVGADLSTLISLSGSPDPALEEKVFDGDAIAYATAQLSQRRSRIRNAMLNSWNHGLVGLVQGEEKKGTLLARGRQVVEDAQKAMGQKRREGGGEALLIVEEADTKPNPTLGRAGTKETRQPIEFDRTLLPEFIELCKLHKARLVLVAPPIRPSMLHTQSSAETRLMQQAVSAGADVLDLSHYPLPEEAFATMHHLIPQYRKEMTAILTDQLKANGLSRGPEGSEPRLITVE